MLHSAKVLQKYEVHATDGKLGLAVDAYVDNESRQVRCLVVETGRWLPGKKLLISQRCLGIPDRDTLRWPIEITREEAEQRQAVVDELPASWKLEELLKARYGGLDTRGGAPASAKHGSVSGQALARAISDEEAGMNVLSLSEIMGYQIEALDGPLGIAEDFLIDDEDWSVRYMVVDTKSWKPGREVLVPPEWVETVSWAERRVHVKISRQKVKTSQRVDRASHSS